MTQIYGQTSSMSHLWADWYERYGLLNPPEVIPINLEIEEYQAHFLNNDQLYLLGLMQPPIHPLQIDGHPPSNEEATQVSPGG